MGIIFFITSSSPNHRNHSHQHQIYKENNVYYIKTWLLHCQLHINEYQLHHKKVSSRKLKNRDCQLFLQFFGNFMSIALVANLVIFILNGQNIIFYEKNMKKQRKKLSSASNIQSSTE